MLRKLGFRKGQPEEAEMESAVRHAAHARGLDRSHRSGQTGHVKSASVSDLKAHLSRYLRMVRRGSEVQVLERGVPIARIVGVGREPQDGDARIERLARAGILKRGRGKLRWVLKERPLHAPGASLGAALEEDREDRA